MAKKEPEQPRPFFESGGFLSPEEIVACTICPQNPAAIPHILGLTGPARGGTTAFGLVMASQSSVDRSYFQPHKGVLRKIVPAIEIKPEDNFIVMKDTFGPIHPEELFDPLDLLLKTGVPPEKITWIFSLRDPLRTFASLTNFVNEQEAGQPMDFDYFQAMQAHTINLFHHYRGLLGENIIPFVFDLFAQDTEFVMGRLLNRAGLNLDGNLSLEFDPQAIQQKMYWGEADPQTHPDYYERIIKPTLSRGRFEYVSNTVKPVVLPPDQAEAIQTQCQPAFLDFLALAKADLGIS